LAPRRGGAMLVLQIRKFSFDCPRCAGCWNLLPSTGTARIDIMPSGRNCDTNTETTMTKLLKQSVRISLLAFAASALIGLVGCGAPAPTTEELWQAAMQDAVFSEDSEVTKLVTLTAEDPHVIWDESG